METGVPFGTPLMRESVRKEVTVPTEKEKMLAGELYDAADPALVAERLRARKLCQALAQLPADAPEQQYTDLLYDLFGSSTNVYVTPPFHCDYGHNIELGRNVYMNFNCVILDVVKVRLGDNVLLGPAVQIYTASHPISADEKQKGAEFGKPVTIGNDVWIGGNAVICPGVSIGDKTVVGAGSVVTRDLPSEVFAAGNPCRVIRQI